VKLHRKVPLAFVALATSLIALLTGAAATLAAPVADQRPLLFSFDGHDTTAGPFTGARQIAIDEASGDVYVLNGAGNGLGKGIESSRRVIDKFNFKGEAQNFPWTGTSSLTGSETPQGAFGIEGFFGAGPGASVVADLSVDNSCAVHEPPLSGGACEALDPAAGDIYVMEETGPLQIFDGEGHYQCTLPRSTIEPSGLTIDATGHIWLIDRNKPKAREFANTGCTPGPPVQIAEFSLPAGNGFPGRGAVDASGSDLYVADTFIQGTIPDIEKYVDGVPDSTLTTMPTHDLSVDQSSAAGHIFAIGESEFEEFEPCAVTGCAGNAVPGNPFGGGLIGAGEGIAYNPAKDWVYVTDLYTDTVKVFGPPASGTAPDVTSRPTDGITKTEATAHGTINPQGVPNSYRFERIKGEGQGVRVGATGGDFKLTMVAARGRGDFNQNSDIITGVTTTSGAFRVGDLIEAGVFPSGTTITAIGPETLTVSAEAASGTTQQPILASQPSEPIAWNALANKAEGPGSVEAALETLIPIGADNVSVSGTPAQSDGTPGEYAVTFQNGLSGQDVDQIGAVSAGLSGGSHQASVATITNGQSWAAAEPLTGWPEANPSIEPSDSATHPVSARLTGLRPNTTYDVRLVGTNTEPEGDPAKRLNSYSSPPDTFTTLPPSPATVTGLAVYAVDTDSAHVAATVDPQGDQTTWQIMTSTEAKAGASKAECEALGPIAFKVAKEGTIALGEAGTVPVAEDLSGLERAQTYCVRLIATNGGGSGQEDAVFTTEAAVPSEAKLAFVAPRTDTSARLNFYVDPEGESPLTYRFEYSADGATWIPLPELVSTEEAHRQIVVAEEVSNLTPDTTYSYRLGLVKNEAGEIAKASLDEEKSFTTRTSAEMTLPSNALGEAGKRGIELVNNPDKGNQHVDVARFTSGSAAPIAADGEKMVWSVAGGAPGGTSGTYNAFLATRSAAGWSSQGLLPPVEEQVGRGALKYRAEFASPAFTHFIFRTEGSLFGGQDPESTYVRLDADRHQEVLAHFDQNAHATSVDVSADTAHVLHVREDTERLEDFGGGTPQPVGLMPGAAGSPPICGIDFDTEFAGGSHLGYAYPGYQWIAATDASRVYFQTKGSNCKGPEGLYLRNREAATTTQIAHSASFIRATTDGRSGFFTTTEALTGEDKNTDLDVYEWTEGVGSTCLTCVVKDANVSPEPNAVRVSDDFSHVYFLSTSRLIPGLGRQGDLNIYALSGDTLRFVADPDSNNVLADLGQMEMSSDGNVLVFLASSQLSADRVAPSCQNAREGNGGHACLQLYRYDDRDGSLECLSCLRGGLTEEGVSIESNNGGFPFRISGDGSTVAFVTAQALLPADINGGADVYEWRNGVLRLITDGETHFPSGQASPDVAGIDAIGENIFFVLADPGLTGYEHDGVDNVYDARIGGGFPPPVAPIHCSGESCQGPLQPLPAAPAPASSGFVGDGNAKGSAKKARCAKGTIRRHGRCAKAHRKQKHRKQRRRAHRNLGGQK
jgi:hypothetical protein